MMKNSFLIIAVLAFASCSQSTRKAESASTDSSKSATVKQMVTSPIYAKMSIAPSIKTGIAVQMRFTVFNDADTVQQFLKWHTPFEPLLSKYLDITNESGEEVNYIGAMAKRMMPPPADSYIKVQPKDSLSVVIDLNKGYNISKSAKYLVKYNAQNMSGLIVKDSVSFVYEK